ncbi:hypothetical protein SCHPADRAFT_1002165 [Schizopora paradoxa]|uniref:Fungal-type protein kinase domain-containing protein n=1 Tax=Schizopora paradoxa TaxID=27342 RepID=A0A0H2RPI2_9AGAM|nr:hypothetical protein SCHPADRAFT_1002165 [Schizopora paradoxa]
MPPPPPKAFINPLIPELIESLLPVKPQQIIDDTNLRRGDQWVKWPGRVDKFHNASGLDVFISGIAEAARRIAPTSVSLKRGRQWTCGFRDKIVINEEEEVKLSGLVLLDSHIHAKDATWKDVMSVMNIVDKEGRYDTELDGLIAQCAEHIFDAQPGRRFVPVFLVAEDDLSIYVFDRTGPMQYMDAVNVHKEPKEFLIAILGTLLLDRRELGYDPTLYHKDEWGVEGTFMKVDGVEYEVTDIYHEGRMHGRGTVCWKGVSQVDGSVVVIKDQWTDISTKNKEVDILEHLNKGEESSVCAPDGVRVIPKLIASEVVTIKAPALVKTQEDGEDVPTTKSESEVQFVNVRDTTALLRKPDDEKRGVLAHWRMVMTPFASKVQEFPSLTGIITILKDIVHAIRILHSKGVMHHDISHYNMMWYYHEGAVRGLLVDYDGAVSSDTNFESDWGTLRFVSLNILTKSPAYPHCYCEDLESLFYVMCYLFTVFDGPYNTRAKRPPGLVDVTEWGGDEGATLSDIYSYKWNSVIKCEERVFSKFAPYFEGLKDCMRRLHRLVFGPNNYFPATSAQEKKYRTRAERLVDRYGKRAGKSEQEVEDVEQEINDRLRIWDRPSDVVFKSFLRVFDDTLEELGRREVANGESVEVEESPKLKKLVKTQVAPANTEIQGGNLNMTKAKAKPFPQAPMQVCRNVPVALAQNTRKRRASSENENENENEELERGRCKRVKPLAAPLQPSAAANVSMADMGKEMKEHYDSKERDENNVAHKPTAS